MKNVLDSEIHFETYMKILSGRNTYKQLIENEKERSKIRKRVNSLKQKDCKFIDQEDNWLGPTEKLTNDIFDRLQVYSKSWNTKYIQKLKEDDIVKNVILRIIQKKCTQIIKETNNPRTLRGIINGFWNYLILQPVKPDTGQLEQEKEFYKILHELIILQINSLKLSKSNLEKNAKNFTPRENVENLDSFLQNWHKKTKTTKTLRRVSVKEAFNIFKPETCAFVLSKDKKDNPSGMVAGWNMKCSLDPPLIAVSISKKNYTHKLITESKEFVVAVPNRKLKKEVKFFGSHHGDKVDKFKQTKIKHQKAKFVNVPLLTDATLNFECELYSTLDVGNHTIFVGKILLAHHTLSQGILLNIGKENENRILMDLNEVINWGEKNALSKTV